MLFRSKHRQIFRNYKGKENQVLYILRNSRDIDAAEFIKRNSLRFRYMPEVDTSARLDQNNQQSAIDYIKAAKPKIISNLTDLFKYVAQNRHRVEQHLSPTVLIKRMLDTLRISIGGDINKTNSGIVVLRDKKASGMVELSPASENDIRYAYIRPNNAYDEPVRCALNLDGEIVGLYKTPEGILKFRELFANAVHHHNAGK